MNRVLLPEAERDGGVLEGRTGKPSECASMADFGVRECWCPSLRWEQRSKGIRSEQGASEFKLREKMSHIQTQGCAVGNGGSAWAPYSSQQFRRCKAGAGPLEWGWCGAEASALTSV